MTYLIMFAGAGFCILTIYLIALIYNSIFMWQETPTIHWPDEVQYQKHSLECCKSCGFFLWYKPFKLRNTHLMVSRKCMCK